MEYKFSKNVSELKPSAIREILKFSSQKGMIPFSAGNPSVEAFPTNEVLKITEDILKNDPVIALQYSVTEGYDPLRQYLGDYLSSKYGVINKDDDILITSGAQRVMNLAIKVLANRGDTVLCEDPSFIGSLNSFRSYGVNLKGIPICSDGIDINALETALKNEQNVRFLYTIPNFQNPTGITMSLEKRKQVYELCKQYGVIILEDNPYGELRFDGEDLPSIKSFDNEGFVIYAGSFSKVLSPGLRVGYAVANKQIFSKMVVCKQTDDVHTSILPQMIAFKFITEYNFEEHLKKLRLIYKQKAELAMQCLDKYCKGKFTYHKPQGGLFIWCTLPDDINMLEFCKKGVENGVAVVPGNAFLADQDGLTNCFRINFSTPTNQQIINGCKILGNLL